MFDYSFGCCCSVSVMMDLRGGDVYVYTFIELQMSS